MLSSDRGRCCIVLCMLSSIDVNGDAWLSGGTVKVVPRYLKLLTYSKRGFGIVGAFQDMAFVFLQLIVRCADSNLFCRIVRNVGMSKPGGKNSARSSAYCCGGSGNGRSDKKAVYILNSGGDAGSPCFTPRCVDCRALGCRRLCMRGVSVASAVAEARLSSVLCVFNVRSMCVSSSLDTVSKASFRSKKRIVPAGRCSQEAIFACGA